MSHDILIVDDEPHILQALKRLLHRDGYDIHLAGNGQDALKILADTEVAVIICDQRMPGMTGDQVIAESVKIRPDAYRITLTGYADLNAAQALINEGNVNRFLLKPWDDEALRGIVREGIKAYELTNENRRLAELTRQQKAEMEAWNQQLEKQVEERTEELRTQNENLLNLQRRVEQSLRDTVTVLAGMLEAYSPNLGIHSKRVAQLARELGSRLELSDAELRDVEFAAYLHDIGKISNLHAEDQHKSSRQGTRQVKAALRHPDSGYAILTHVHGFEDIAWAVQYQHEHYDGSGYPEGLKGEDIPIASRIIAVVNAYDKAVFPSSRPTSVSHDAGRRVLVDGQSKHFDPSIARLLLEYLEEAGTEIDGDAELQVSPQRLKPEMILSRPVNNIDGVLLLKEGTSLTPEFIERIRALSDIDPLLTGVFVRGVSDEKPNQETEASPPPSKASSKPDFAGDAPPFQFAPRKRVLIVDDDALICSALSRELRRARLETFCVDNGRAAQRILGVNHFDLLIVDVAMPVMSGESLVAHVQECWPDLPCIVLTGDASKEQIVRLYKVPNVAKILIKPWDSDQLMATITSVLRDHSKDPVGEPA